MLRTLASALGLASMLWLSSAQALGLGDIDVRSRLNQRFSASIPVLSATPAELESLTVRIAGAEEFARSGIERSDYLASISFAVTGSGSATQIKVSSDQASRERSARSMTNDLLDSSLNSCSARRSIRPSTGLATSCDRSACCPTSWKRR